MATRRTVTATHSVVVPRPPAAVWDYTQDFAPRAEWDDSVRSATVIGTDPRRVRVELRGVGRFVLQYKLERRPERTSAAFTEIESPWFSGGGGSWDYLALDDGAATRWSQINTLELKPRRFAGLLAPLIERSLRGGMRRAMARAARILARSGGAPR